MLFVLVNKREQSPFREMFPRQHSDRHRFRFIHKTEYRWARNYELQTDGKHTEEENSNMDSLLVKLGQEVLELFPQWDTNTSWDLWGYQCVTHAHMYIKINETCTFLLLICIMTFMLHVAKGPITPKGVKGIFPSSEGLPIEFVTLPEYMQAYW